MSNERSSTWHFVLMSLCLFVVIQLNTSQVHAANHWDTSFGYIDQVYDDFTVLKSEVTSGKERIAVQRTMNNNALKLVNVKINNIDLELINQLQVAYEQTVREHSSLLEHYAALSKQATAAKKSKNKKLADLLDLQRNKIQYAVVAARTDIRAKKDALATMKKQRSVKMKKLKETLAPIQNFKKMITAENKTITTVKQTYSAIEKRYKASVKQGDAVTAATDLKLMYDQIRMMQYSQHQILNWEIEISKIISLAEVSFPK